MAGTPVFPGSNFYWHEVTTTDRKRLARRNLDALQGDAHARASAVVLARTILQPIRDNFGATTVNSWYRCPELNEDIGGASNSQHLRAEAADIKIPGVSCLDLARWIAFRSGLRYGQVIAEDPDNDGIPTWVHVSLGSPYRSAAKCMQALYFNGDDYLPLTREG